MFFGRKYGDDMKKIFVRKILYFLGKQKIKKNTILFEGSGKYDNCWVLYLYCKKHRKDLKVKFYSAEYKKGNRISFFRLIEKFFIYLSISKYEVIFDSYCTFDIINPNTKTVYLGHGMAFKKVKHYVDRIGSIGPEIVLPSQLVIDEYKKKYELSKCTFYKSLCPRIELLKFDNERLLAFEKLIKNTSKQKIIGCMLTFRRKPNMFQFDEKSMIPFDVDFDNLNLKLKEKNIIFVVKLHHVFDYSSIPYEKYSNIKFIKNLDLLKCGLESTSFMSFCDALISDYSSAFIDYLLLNRPIYFYNADFDEYKNSDIDGFLWDDPEKFMPGDKFSNFEGLLRCISDFSNGIDLYLEERRNVCLLLNGTTKLDESDWCKNIINHYYPVRSDLDE